ncbi:hypothetical protein ACFXJ8_07665 [Nonomuraea sp. NPDC059194]|uniref:hypothetical protein n=1 Tax=Nonomuraea sp. NPDC059194 TaxID=3346764 RepID=UPI0036B5CA0D
MRSSGMQLAGTPLEGGQPSTASWVAVGLICAATLAGAWLARRESERVSVWLAIASAVMLVVAVADMLPDAWHDAVETGMPLWVVAVAVVTGFLVVTYFTRKGCGCAADTARRAAGLHAPGLHRKVKEAAGAALFGGMGTAAALTTHRAIEGATLALTVSAVVVAALMIHSTSEGLALTALLDMARQRLAPWLVVACLSPALGVLAAAYSPLPPTVVPVLLGVVTGVLLRTAIVGMRLAASKQQNGALPRRYVVAAAVVAVVVGATLVVAHWAGEEAEPAAATHSSDANRS